MKLVNFQPLTMFPILVLMLLARNNVVTANKTSTAEVSHQLWYILGGHVKLGYALRWLIFLIYLSLQTRPPLLR